MAPGLKRSPSGRESREGSSGQGDILCKGWEAGGGPEDSGKASNMLEWLWGW